MFVRFRAGRRRLALSLVETKRVDGKVRHEHVATLGSIETPLTMRGRITFWARLNERLTALGSRLGSEDEIKIMDAVHARVPIPTVDERRELKLQNAKADERTWSALRDMNAAQAHDQEALGVTAKAAGDLSPRWRALIGRLWELDGKSIIGFLPEIVAMIKSTERRALAELALLNVFHSPKVRNMPLRLKRPAVVHPAHQAMKDMADAAGLPFGKDRADAIAKIRSRALTGEEVMLVLNSMPKEKLDTASAEARRVRRARKKLGISRKEGRPRKPDTDSP